MSLYKIKYVDGSVGIMSLGKNAKIKEEVAKLNEGHETDIVLGYSSMQESDIPKSRNWRNAWDHDLSIDLEKAKEVQKELIVKKAHERVEKDAFGNQDFSDVQTELEQIDFDAIDNLDDLYNSWPASIDYRSGTRKYEV